MAGKIIYTANGMRLLILFLLMASFAGKAYSFPPDSLKASNYPIDDPRNPGCPCHKYQELADKEYAALLKKQTKSYETDGISSSFGERNTKSILHADNTGIRFSPQTNTTKTSGRIILHTVEKSGKSATHARETTADKLKRRPVLALFKSLHGITDKKTSHHNKKHHGRHKKLWRRKPGIDSCSHW